MGPYLSSPNQQKHTISGQNKSGKIEWSASEMQGWRNTMEDSHIAETDLDQSTTHVFGVFDGHGGKEVAKFVQKYFVLELKQNENFKSGNIQTALEETFLRMDVLLETPEGKKELSEIKNGSDRGDSDFVCYAGCTANVAVIYNDILYVANAGDSRTVLSIDGEAYAMSEDHKPDNPIEKKRIIDCGGFITDGRVNGNLNLSRAMGDMQYKHDKARNQKEQLIISFPDIKEFNLKEQKIDFILMGCDGIWETKSNQELMDIIAEERQKGTSQKLIVELLLEALISPDTSFGVGCDNMTTLLVYYSQ